MLSDDHYVTRAQYIAMDLLLIVGTLGVDEMITIHCEETG